MLEHLDGGDLAATVKMVRAAFPGAIVLVEGGKDLNVFKRLLDMGACYLINSNGRESLLLAIESLDSEAFAGVVGIADADFWNIDGDAPTSPNLFSTDFHDLEVMMLESSALDVLLSEYASEGKMAKFFSSKKIKTARTWLKHQAELIGRLRLIASRHGIPLDFNGIRFQSFFARDSLVLDKEKCISSVLSNTADSTVSRADIDRYLGSLERRVDHRQLCCGHDMCELLAIALRRGWGSQVLAIASPRNVEALLRMGYSKSDFELSQLYARLVMWQASHSPYRVIT